MVAKISERSDAGELEGERPLVMETWMQLAGNFDDRIKFTGQLHHCD